MEEWRPIKGFEEYYMVSNKGNVKRIKALKNKIYYTYKERKLKPILTKGYLRVVLQHENKKVNKFIHVLVAESFMNYSQKENTSIHHKDHNRTNNCLENLQIVNKSEHSKYHNSLQDRRVCNPEEIKQLYLEGYTEREVVQILNIGKTTVGKYIKRFGISRDRHIKHYRERL